MCAGSSAGRMQKVSRRIEWGHGDDEMKITSRTHSHPGRNRAEWIKYMIEEGDYHIYMLNTNEQEVKLQEHFSGKNQSAPVFPINICGKQTSPNVFRRGERHVTKAPFTKRRLFGSAPALSGE